MVCNCSKCVTECIKCTYLRGVIFCRGGNFTLRLKQITENRNYSPLPPPALRLTSKGSQLLVCLTNSVSIYLPKSVCPSNHALVSLDQPVFLYKHPNSPSVYLTVHLFIFLSIYRTSQNFVHTSNSVFIIYFY